MANSPERRKVRPSPALFEQARTLFGPERGSDGYPSFGDFEEFLLPHLLEAVSVTWSSARPVSGFEGEVRELVTRPHVMFGPARVTGLDDGDTVWLIGFEPDMGYWENLGDWED